MKSSSLHPSRMRDKKNPQLLFIWWWISNHYMLQSHLRLFLAIHSITCKYMIWKIAVLDMDRKNIMFIFRLRWSNPTDSALNHHLASGCECSRHLQLALRGHPSDVADLRFCLMITVARKLLFEPAYFISIACVGRGPYITHYARWKIISGDGT